MTTYPKKLMLLGSGELGKEITIAAKRIGCYVIACDRYENAPAMQLADQKIVFEMTNPIELTRIIEKHKPDIVIPEIEALAADALQEIEKKGFNIIPNARATEITMNRDKIRDLAANKLQLKTAKFKYAKNIQELNKAIKEIGFPAVIKPIMSSSGKGQSIINKEEEIESAWEIAMNCSRGISKEVIVEEFLNFNLEITLLTIRQKNGTTLFCEPIGHVQKNGDYQNSWQPANLNYPQLQKAQEMAKIITDELGGAGLFGVEFFICDEEIIFSELSPRPHDTGLVTIISQNLNEFELHVRAILGLPIPEIIVYKPSASRVLLADQTMQKVTYEGIEESLAIKDSKLLIFGKDTSKKGRRMGVTLANGNTIEEAQSKADKSAKCIKFKEGID